MTIKIFTKNEEETIDLGKKIAKYLFKGSIITLTGDLGAGKTTFVKGVAKGIGIKHEVSSPTFNILKCYYNDYLNMYHIDAYRLEDVQDENKNIGLEEVIEGEGVTLIEWPMFIKNLISSDILNINILLLENNVREISISSSANKYLNLMNSLKEEEKL